MPAFGIRFLPFNHATFAVVLLVAGHAFAEIPKNPTREQIIASCTLKSVTVQERVALQQCKTKLDAAELLQSMYQDRLNECNKALYPWDDDSPVSYMADPYKPLGRMRDTYKVMLSEINDLVVTLKAAPAPKTMKKK